MNIQVIALHEGEIAVLAKQPGVFLRRRRDGSVWTQVRCDLLQESGRWWARSPHPLPDDAPIPEFRAQVDIKRDRIVRQGVTVVLRWSGANFLTDPEREVLAPILVTRHRFLFEFVRGVVLHVSPTGRAEVRTVAIDPVSGEVGTRTIAHFHTGLLGLTERCVQQIAGVADLFPVDPNRTRSNRISTGEAQLTWTEEGNRDDAEQTDSWNGLANDGLAEHQAG